MRSISDGRIANLKDDDVSIEVSFTMLYLCWLTFVAQNRKIDQSKRANEKVKKGAGQVSQVTVQAQDYSSLLSCYVVYRHFLRNFPS